MDEHKTFIDAGGRIIQRDGTKLTVIAKDIWDYLGLKKLM
jgi:hypothetical protein